jgi:hypothetical protein
VQPPGAVLASFRARLLAPCADGGGSLAARAAETPEPPQASIGRYRVSPLPRRSTLNRSASMIREFTLVFLLGSVLPLVARAQEPPSLPMPPPDTLASACAAEEFRQFDFWLGRWSVGPVGRPPGGVNEITRVAQGCAVQERYHNANGYTGTSLNFYHPQDRAWTQIWVDNAGLRLHLTGGLDDHGNMVLTGERTDPEGRPVLDRITWIPMPTGTVHQIWDQSLDRGETWANVFTGEYVALIPN